MLPVHLPLTTLKKPNVATLRERGRRGVRGVGLLPSEKKATN